MQIEETFRELKSHRRGYGIRNARSRSHARPENLLLLPILATLATCLAGLAAQAANMARYLQANTIRDAIVLSVFVVDRRMLSSHRIGLTRQAIHHAMRTLPSLVHELAQHA
jgi:hypothetical protein